jgi:phage shock protein PspC (stress-responsive transcriptional regulator)
MGKIKRLVFLLLLAVGLTVAGEAAVEIRYRIGSGLNPFLGWVLLAALVVLGVMAGIAAVYQFYRLMVRKEADRPLFLFHFWLTLITAYLICWGGVECGWRRGKARSRYFETMRISTRRFRACSAGVASAGKSLLAAP